MSILNVLASFIEKTSFIDIPFDLREQAKIRIIDLISACGLGTRSEVRNPLAEFTEVSHPTLNVTPLFSRQVVSVYQAAASNAFTANSSGIEDGSRFAGAHPSSGIIPAALAASQTTGASGADFIVSVIVAYEVYLRVGYALYPHNVRKGFHPSAILAPLGAAAAVGKLLGLDTPALRAALSLACLSSGGLKVAFEEYASKCYQVARGVKGGFEAALLAQSGMQGPEHVFERGFLRAYGSDKNSMDLEDLGSRFLLPQTYLKIHGGCRLIHPCIDAVLYLREMKGILTDQVESISIKINSVAYGMERDEVKGPLDARFNTPFLVAVALKEGEVSERQITDEMLHDEIIKDLRSKTSIEVDPELDMSFPAHRGAIVNIRTRKGSTVGHRVDLPLGEPENPLTLDQVREKFKKSLTGIISESKIMPVYQFLEGLDKRENLFPLFQYLEEKF